MGTRDVSRFTRWAQQFKVGDHVRSVYSKRTGTVVEILNTFEVAVLPDGTNALAYHTYNHDLEPIE